MEVENEASGTFSSIPDEVGTSKSVDGSDLSSSNKIQSTANIKIKQTEDSLMNPEEEEDGHGISSTEFVMPVPLSITTSSVKKRNNIISISDEPVRLEEVEEEQAARNKSQHIQVSVPYTEPEWGAIPDTSYSFDVLKNGKIIDSVSLEEKSFQIFGRLPSCDVTLDHPSLSRHHAVVQFSHGGGSYEKGWYIYDLDSTHGTWVNKRKVPPNVYLRLKVGYLIKFGGSKRLHILQGPSTDEEEECDLSFSEMKEQRERLRKEAEVVKQMEMQEKMARHAAEKKLMEDQGCAWGMGDDAVEMDEGNSLASIANLVAENESLYIDDPKKSLKGFYEREGCDLPDYQFTEAPMGKHKCVLHLPVDGPNGEELIAEAVVSGKRKDAVVACALGACRILDKLAMLRSSTHEGRKRKQKHWEDNDFYDSDEDTFLDRTGIIEKKRAMRMKKAGKDKTETYESLMKKHIKVTEDIKEVEAKLAKAKAESEALASEDMDELDAYMNSIKSGAMDPKTRIRLKGDVLRLNREEQRLRRLVNIARPASLPPLKPSSSPANSLSVDSLARKMNAQQKSQKKAVTAKQNPFEEKPDDFEEEEDDDNSGRTATNNDPVTSLKQTSRVESDASSRKQSSQNKTRNLSDQTGKSSTYKGSTPVIKGPFFPPSMLAEIAKGKSSAEAFMSTKDLLTQDIADSEGTERPDPH